MSLNQVYILSFVCLFDVLFSAKIFFDIFSLEIQEHKYVNTNV